MPNQNYCSGDPAVVDTFSIAGKDCPGITPLCHLEGLSTAMAAHLRIYNGPDSSTASANTVTVPAGDVLPLLFDAYLSQRTWLRDFADDEITISSDLYDVLLAYQHVRRPSA